MRHICKHVSETAPPALFAVAALSLYMFLAWCVTHDSRLMQLDQDLHDHLQEVSRGEQPMLRVWAVVSELGGTYFRGVVMALVAAILWLRRQRRTAVAWMVAVVGAALFNDWLKAAIARTRPKTDLDCSPSFVSGHAMGAVVLYCLLAYLLVGAARGFWLRTAIVFTAAALVLLISLSRIVLGRHWASDVAGGLALGVAWTAVTIAVLQVLRRHVPPDEGPEAGRLVADGEGDDRGSS